MCMQALQDPSKTCVVWINAGHEVFQEARAKTTTFLEQAIAGYHEGNDVVYAMSHPDFISGAAARPGGSGETGKDEPSVGGMRCLLYTSPSPRDRQKSRMPSSA